MAKKITFWLQHALNFVGYTAPVSVASANVANSNSPLNNRTGSPPETNASGNAQQAQATASGQSPMAALMSVADNLPPGSPRSAGGSPPGNAAPRSASRGSQHSPNSTGWYKSRLAQYIQRFDNCVFRTAIANICP